ncbi:hypothetical protein FA95DRAFT_1578739 [Auriscalpium vulgare]|uniref:Uncharacterized protein n=1 Tax=Auriscalpium vulgare TaxID=40419 RepID=A0ACB8R123_9AGAM|nr:hypothetical protein FA95DRAFT_1578739 [Auriscalpium vulgare]
MSAPQDKGKQKAKPPVTPPEVEGEDDDESFLKVLEEFNRTIDDNLKVTNGVIEMATEAMNRANAARDGTQQLRTHWSSIRRKLRKYRGLETLDDERTSSSANRESTEDLGEIRVSELRLDKEPRFKYMGITYSLAELIAPRGEGESAESHAYREKVADGYYEWKRSAREKLLSAYENLLTEKELEEDTLTLKEIEKMLVKQDPEGSRGSLTKRPGTTGAKGSIRIAEQRGSTTPAVVTGGIGTPATNIVGWGTTATVAKTTMEMDVTVIRRTAMKAAITVEGGTNALIVMEMTGGETGTKTTAEEAAGRPEETTTATRRTTMTGHTMGEGTGSHKVNHAMSGGEETPRTGVESHQTTKLVAATARRQHWGAP